MPVARKAICRLLLFLLALAFGTPVSAQQPKYPLPADVVAAWEKAGAHVGWMKWRDEREDFAFRQGTDAGQPGEVPAFRLRLIPPGKLASLPSPPVPFGLDFRLSDVTDEGFKGISTHKQLQALNLLGTRVTAI